MPNLQLIWLHPTGWTLLVVGFVLLVLTEVTGLPATQGRRYRWLFGALIVIGAVCLAAYFRLNAGVGIYHEY